MKSQIKKLNADAEFFIDEGCHIIELCNDASDPSLSVARARVEPGVTTQWHSLKGTVERYVILEGRGLVEVGDLAPAEVGPGDTVIIPAGCPQRIANTAKTDLIFLALCTPRFVPANYRALNASK